MSAPSRPQVQKLFALVVAMVWLLCGGALLWTWRRRAALPSGEELNRLAWEATFRERGLPVPASGPRDGYWGKRLPRLVKDEDLGWHEAEVKIPALVESGPYGVQTASSGGGARCKLLIVGGSVAWGAYASAIDKTYFQLLARKLGERGHPVQITVLAAGAWEADNELRALRAIGFSFEPSLVVFLNGLNDIMDAARRHKPDREAHPSMELRAAVYLEKMERASELARSHATPVVFALQPLLLRKATRSALEQRILDTTFDAKLPLAAALEGVERLQSVRERLCRATGVFCIDASRPFERETATTFTDVYHFADAGHELLAGFLAESLAPILDAGPAECRAAR
jgi:hypothetical protein